MKSNLLPVAKEGFIYIGYSFLATIAFVILDFELLGFISFLFLAFFIFAYRNPERVTQDFEEFSVISPVDGVITSIENIKDSEYAYKLEIESSYLNVALLRIPFNSSLENISFFNGSRLSNKDALSEKLNESVELILSDDKQNKMKIFHKVKESFDGIKLSIFKKQNLTQSMRYGTMVNGITTIYLPDNFKLDVSVLNKVIGSETLLGYYS